MVNLKFKKFELTQYSCICDENHIGLHYTTHMINCHLYHEGFNAVCKSTVNVALLRLQPKITNIQNIQQGTKNKGKRKEARRRQKKRLIMLNRLPEDR